MKDNFVLETNGTKYACQRTIEGIGIQTQTIDVLGIGTKVDTARYGPGEQPASSMLSVARVIAGSIIKG
jgi:hypothetical protein